MTKYRKNKIQKAFDNFSDALEQLEIATKENMEFVASIFVFDENGDCSNNEYNDFCRVWTIGYPESCVINAESLLDAVKEELKNEQLQKVLENNEIVPAEDLKK